MTWRRDRATVRSGSLKIYDAPTADYDNEWGHGLLESERVALLNDLREHLPSHRLFDPGVDLRVLDVGAGTGIFITLLRRLRSGLTFEALEPSPEMRSHLEKLPKPKVKVTAGWTDAQEDRRHYEENAFDIIVSRQVTCGLYDPIKAFNNWRFWLKPDGEVILIDGLYPRDAWRGSDLPKSNPSDAPTTIVDDLPLGGSTSLAAGPYLLEYAGFKVVTVALLSRLNCATFDRLMHPGVVVLDSPKFLVYAQAAKGQG